MNGLLKTEKANLHSWQGPTKRGKITKITNTLVECTISNVQINSICFILTKNNDKIPAQVITVKNDIAILYPFLNINNINVGSEVLVIPYRPIKIDKTITSNMLGKIVNAFGGIIGPGEATSDNFYPIYDTSITNNFLELLPINNIFSSGIKAIDGLCSIGLGQRIGVFSSPGCGKTSLITSLVKNSITDVNIVALIGERGREINDFINSISYETLKKTIIIASPSNDSAIMRMQTAELATSIAISLQNQGCDVLFVMDSLSRYAAAIKEVGLSLGEPLTSRGYTASMFTKLPKITEAFGNKIHGSVTSIFNVLLESQDSLDPLSEYIMSLLDGHIFLSSKMAKIGSFPAIDILKSLSRCMPKIISERHLSAANQLKSLLLAYKDVSELIEVGAYSPGSNSEADRAISKIDIINKFLCQSIDSFVSLDETLLTLFNIIDFS